MNKLKIGLDVDETISAFMAPYIKRFGLPKNPEEIGYNCHNILRHDRDFWLNVPLIHRPDFMPELFCSKRVNPKSWSKKYLFDKLGIPKSIPFFQLWGQWMPKSKVLKGKIDVYVDDSIPNFLEINNAGIPCLLMDSEWNRDYETPLRIFSLEYKVIEDKYIKYFTDGKH